MVDLKTEMMVSMKADWSDVDLERMMVAQWVKRMVDKMVALKV